MSGGPLRFTELRIERLPGVPRERRFSLTDLSPDVTLVLGPNGAGKTQCGRALMELLWPGRTGLERPTIAGTWTLDGVRWSVDIEAGHATWRRDGEAAEPPTLPPVEARAHHWLGLRELLVDGGPDADATQEFARRIAREMQGGFDVDAAAAALGFADRPTRPRKDRSEFERRRAALQAVETAARGRHEESSELARRRAERDAAMEATTTVRRLDRMIDLRRASDELVSAEAELAERDPRLDRLRGDERQRRDALCDQRGGRAAQRTQAVDGLARAEAAATATGLPEGGVPEVVRTVLTAEVDALHDVTQRLRQARSDVEAAAAIRDAARAAVGDAVDPAHLAAIGSVPPAELLRHAADGAAVRAATAAAEFQRRQSDERLAEMGEWAATGESTSREATEVSVDRHRRGLEALFQWIATPAAHPASRVGATPRWSWPLLVAAALVVGLVAALAVLVQPGWLVVGLAGVALIWLARPPRGGTTEDAGGSDRRAARAEDFGRLGLEAPETWSLEAVRDRLDALRVDLMRGERRLEDHRRATEAKDAAIRAVDEAAAARTEHEAASVILADRLGVPIVTGRDDWLHVLGTNIVAWHEADRRVAALSAAADGGQRILGEVGGRILRTIEPFVGPPEDGGDGDPRGVDVEFARATLRDFERRTQARQKADADRAAAATERARAEREIASLEAQLTELFAAIELDAGRPEDHAQLDRWLDELDDYRRLNERVRDARARVEGLRRDLGANVEPPHADLATLETQREEAGLRAARLEEIATRIGAIEQAIETDRQGRDVEAAARDFDEARQTLLAQREEAERTVVGDAVVDWIRGETTDRTRPEVLRRAADFFRRITHGRYDLQLEPGGGDPAAFLAIDTRDGVSKRLGELSAGERIQLLLSVRLGFLEQEERGVRLPIVLDEILGTTDDARALAIIEAVVEICRSGRQVFYFTAQPDEVGKWIGRLEGDSDITLRVVDLAAVCGLAEADAAPLPIQRPTVAAIPAPDGLDHEAYGRQLGVPGLQPAGDPGSVHLWHVIDDPDRLHTLLERGVRELGPLTNLMRCGAAAALGDVLGGTGDAAAMEARRAAIEATFRAWRVGRGRTVDREALQDSRAVSGVFIDRMSELAAASGGDAGTMLGALEERSVSGFRSDKIEQLRQYFEEHRHLDREVRLDAEDILHRVLGSVAAELGDGRLDHAWVQGLIARLPTMTAVPAVTGTAGKS